MLAANGPLTRLWPMADFSYVDMLPMGEHSTPYRLITTDGVGTFEANRRTFL